MAENLIIEEACLVLKYDAKQRYSGYDLSNKPCAYGMVLKYYFKKRGWSYKLAGEYLNISAQGINHIVNRMPKDRYFEEDIERYCNAFGINQTHFLHLSEEVERLMEEDESTI